MTSRLLPIDECETPVDAAGVAALVASAAAQGRAVYTLGGGTHASYGTRPTRPGLGLSTRGLGRLVDYPARDLTITVEAGMTLEVLAEHLAKESQRLPVELPQPGQATIGGAVAIAAAGPLRYRWGTMRDYVIGLEAVDGEGRRFSTGGRVVKNAAGYDLSKLLTGSMGTLAVITQVSLMVRPMAASLALVCCGISGSAAGETILARLVKSNTGPVAIELLAGPHWHSDAFGDARAGVCGRLLVGFEGRPGEVEWMVEQLLAEWRLAGVSATKVFRDVEAAALWRRLVDFSSPPLDGPATIDVEINAMPSGVVHLVDVARQVESSCSIQAHAGDGVLWVRFPAPADADTVLRPLRAAVDAVHGTMVVRSRPWQIELDRQTIWGPQPSGFAVMEGLRRRFDPRGILNPGRFLFD